MQKNTSQLALGGVAAVVVASAIILAVQQMSSQDIDDVAQAPATQSPDAPETGAVDIVRDAENTPDTPDDVTIDTFLLDDSGIAVMAGRTTPGGTVSLQLANDVVATVTADANGSFATTVAVAAADQPRELTILLDGVPTQQRDSIIIAPSAAPVAVAEAAPTAEEGAEVETETAVVAEATPVADGTESVETAEPVAEAETTAHAPQVLAVDTTGVRVVSEGPEAISGVALDAITYDSAGDVVLSGRAPIDGTVQIYVDNRPVTSAPVAAQGDWRIALPDVDTGTYTLRIDEVDSAGDVQSRIETPFQRSSAEDVAALMADQTETEGFSVATRTVQPGSTLWAIARDTLGDGVLYVSVFEANRDLIRDPDLIYPGQVFRIPQAGGQADPQ